jgi:hypothetical protein
MKLVRDTPAQTFAPELPWLKTDPDMQTAEAYRGTIQMALADGYDLLAPALPGGTQFAMKRICHPDHLLVGEMYWLRYTGYTAQQYGKDLKHVDFLGRFEGIGRQGSKKRAKSMAKYWPGWVGMTMSDDNPAFAAANNEARRADGTREWFVDFDSIDVELYQITHYVKVPLELAPQFVEHMGQTDAQAEWEKEYRQVLADKAVEVLVSTVGGFAERPCRTVLSKGDRGYSRLDCGGAIQTFALLLSEHTQLNEYQAKRRKEGAVAITYYENDTRFGLGSTTRYYRAEDAAIAVEWVRSIERLQRAQAAAHQEADRVHTRRMLAKEAEKQQREPLPAPMQPTAPREVGALALAA